ncbi:DUF4013 domain-containing protein [Candidatus Nomurabacteria bacterium]|nr:DUF4013 domain-containing protein [Candidatus Nomurabacteria bacterium]MCB9803522.1 DUF4013 domain-containing protein [Candidatus Nomurabacteria bacterium]
MRIDIQKALKYIFDDQDWIMKVGILIVVFAVVSFLTQIMNIGGSVITNIGDTGLFENSTISGIIPLITQMTVSASVMIISLPVTIYISGYSLETTLNVMNGKASPLPDHNNLGYKLRLWLGNFVIGLAPKAITATLALILIVPLAILISINWDSSSVGIWVLLMIFAIFIVGIVDFFINSLIRRSMTYLFLKSGSISGAFNFREVMKISRMWWKDLLLVALIGILAIFVIWIVGVMSCFFSFIVSPALNVLYLLFMAHLIGQVYSR